MSEYKDFVKDFACRTYKNLEFIEKTQEARYEELYEFTQLINSLLGLLVIPQQRENDRIDNNFVEAETLEHLRSSIERDDYNRREFKDIIRHMRNAVAHGSVQIVPNDGTITGIIFTDNSDHNKKQFRIILTCKVLRSFVQDFSEKLIAKL